MKNAALLLWGMALLVLAAGCNIEFDIETQALPETNQLDGNWGGTQQDAGGAMHTLELEVRSGGQITAYRVDGQDTGTRGSLSGPGGSGKVFGMLLNTGARGGLLTNPSYTHAAYLDSGGNVGVLERDAQSSPTFFDGDVAQPSWGGTYLLIDADYGYVDSGGSLMNVALDRRFDGLDGDGRLIRETAVLSLDDPAFGRYQGAYVNIADAADAGVFVMLLTPDKTHAGAYTCTPDESALPVDCRFFLWAW